jgi:hypothetical protein
VIEGILAIDHADETSGVPKPLGYLVPRQGAKIRARLHPWAIAGVWAWQAAWSLLAAYPAAALVGAAYGNDPRGDLPLWEPGAHALLDLLRTDIHGVGAAGAGAAIVLVAASLAGLLPLAGLMTAMAHATHGGRRVGASRAIGGAIGSARALAGLFIAVSLAEGLAVAVAVGVGEVTEGSAHAWLGEARAQMLGIAFGIVAIVPALALGVVHDLARAAVVRLQLGTLPAWVAGVRAFRRSPSRLVWSWTWRGIVGVVPVGLVALVAGRLAWRGGVALLALAALHQAVALLRVALRASWLARALRTVELTNEG